MRHRKFKALLPAALCLVLAHQAWGGMRCGNALIDEGDSMARVRALCGAPALIDHSTVVHSSTVRAGGRRFGQSDTVAEEVPVETWTYNFGPTEFMVQVRFVNGKVTVIETLHEFGYN